jgi:exodeoxyribonuclease VII large subunit
VQIGHFLQLRRAVLNKAAEKLDNLSPLNILGRGYSITFKMPEGIIMKEARALGKGDVLKTKLHQGEVLSQVVAVDSAQCTVESAERKRQKTEF